MQLRTMSRIMASLEKLSPAGDWAIVVWQSIRCKARMRQMLVVNRANGDVFLRSARASRAAVGALANRIFREKETHRRGRRWRHARASVLPGRGKAIWTIPGIVLIILQRIQELHQCLPI